MKKLLSGFTIAAILMVFSATDVLAQANPGGVEVQKNGAWNLNVQCQVDPIASTSSTVQIKNGNVHLITVFFETEGSCLEAGDPIDAIKGPIGITFDGNPYVGTFLWTPSGNIKVQLVDNSGNVPTP